MLRLRVIQAEFGDCLILEYGKVAKPQHILIDGGPSGTYPKHLKSELEAIQKKGGGLELAVLSHVDNDHIIGLLEMMAERLDDRDRGKPLIPIQAMWHNAFSRTIGDGKDFSGEMESAFSINPVMFASMEAANSVIFGIAEGDKLLTASDELKIPLNPNFPDSLITTDDAPCPIRLNGVNLYVVGPTVRNLDRLKKDWQTWLEKLQRRAPYADSFEAEKIDRSVPNLSSIMLLAVSGRRKILLTGDGLGDDLMDGLKQSNLLDASGKLHVNILKLPHHGSVRNVRRSFFDTITADTYVISANGKYNNPDLATLIWLVEAAKQQKRKIQIVATNQTESIQQLVDEYSPQEYGYQLIIMQPDQNSVLL